MLWLLFGLLYISEPQYIEMTDLLNRFNCSDRICESSAGRPSPLSRNDIYLQKFQILGTDNCSDCGVYEIELGYIKEYYFNVLTVKINQSDIKSTVGPFLKIIEKETEY